MRDQNFSMRVERRFGSSIDELRKEEPDLPSRTEMVHRLVDRAYAELQNAKRKAKD